MRAAVFERYGAPSVIRIAQVPAPTPRADEILIRVSAAAVTVADARIRGANFPSGFAPFARLAFGMLRPRKKTLGNTFSGVVEAVGAKVEGFAVGDEVCGMTGSAMGTHAEQIAVAAKHVVHKPAEGSHEDAAAMLFGGTTALYFLRDQAAVEEGASVLINGASGAVGTNAVQLAKHFGATVTAVTSTPNLELIAELGADHTVDYTKTPLHEVTNRFDVVFDTVGNVSPAPGKKLLTDGGVLLLAAADLTDTVKARGNVKTGVAPERREDFEFLLQLMTDGRLVAVTEQVFDLADIAAAHERVDSGRKVGNIIVRPGA